MILYIHTRTPEVERPLDVVANVLDCDTVVSEFEL